MPLHLPLGFIVCAFTFSYYGKAPAGKGSRASLDPGGPYPVPYTLNCIPERPQRALQEKGKRDKQRVLFLQIEKLQLFLRYINSEGITVSENRAAAACAAHDSQNLLPLLTS